MLKTLKKTCIHCAHSNRWLVITVSQKKMLALTRKLIEPLRKETKRFQLRISVGIFFYSLFNVVLISCARASCAIVCISLLLCDRQMRSSLAGLVPAKHTRYMCSFDFSS